MGNPSLNPLNYGKYGLNINLEFIHLTYFTYIILQQLFIQMLVDILSLKAFGTFSLLILATNLLQNSFLLINPIRSCRNGNAHELVFCEIIRVTKSILITLYLAYPRCLFSISTF